jgi:hypothetical protein
MESSCITNGRESDVFDLLEDDGAAYRDGFQKVNPDYLLEK